MSNKIPKDRKCSQCGSDKTYVKKNGHVQWYFQNKNPKLPLCGKCWAESWRDKNPLKVRQYKQKQLEHQIFFLGKSITLDKPIPRTGICTMCKMSLKKGEIKATVMHHVKYDSNNPLAYTIELCQSCHNIEHALWKPKQKTSSS